MKAAVFNKKHNIEVKEVDIRKLEKNEVLIGVKYCGVCGTDLHIFHGDEGAAAVNPPTILGHEFSGVVEEIGSDVKDLQLGDRVSVDPNNMCGTCDWCRDGQAHFCENVIGYGTTTDGGFSEKVIVQDKQVYKITDNLSFEEAAMTETISCCVHGIDLCNIKEGSTTLVIGGGPIGLMMLQLAKNGGASTVILSELVEAKRVLANELGADIVINPLEIDLSQWISHNGLKVDTVIECVGNIGTIRQAIDCVAPCGTVMMFGLTAPTAEVNIKPFEIFKKEIKLTSSFINPYTFKRALNILESGRIDVKSIITDVVELDQIVEVFTNDDYRKRGKILIKTFQ